MRIAIIGAGWLGCHLGLVLRNLGHKIAIYEKSEEIFSAASGYNQCRLHLGFHYPRAIITRKEARDCFKPFLDQYSEFVIDIQNNLYAVSKKGSQVDFQSFCEIFENEEVNFEIKDPREFNLKNVQGVIDTEEKAIDLVAAKDYFKNELSDVLFLKTQITEIINSASSIEINNQVFDYCINCSYQQFLPEKSFKCFYEACLMLLYKRNSEERLALTVVDGPFGSFYPAPSSSKNENLYYLSTVQDTPLGQYDILAEAEKRISSIALPEIKERKQQMENLISYYYPSFREEFTYLDFVTSIKTKINSKNDERNSFFQLDDRLVHAFIGKISQIKLIEDMVLGLLAGASFN